MKDKRCRPQGKGWRTEKRRIKLEKDELRVEETEDMEPRTEGGRQGINDRKNRGREDEEGRNMEEKNEGRTMEDDGYGSDGGGWRLEVEGWRTE